MERSEAKSSEAQTWEAMKNQIYVIADTLAEGIVKQFPRSSEMTEKGAT